MDEVNHDEAEYFRSEVILLQFSDANFKSPISPTLFIDIHDEPTTNSGSESYSSSSQSEQVEHPKDEWLPLTESRNGNVYYAVFHILNSNIGFQALMVPVAFATLGWVWGSVCLSIAFIWQLYTIFVLIELHESASGKRHSRYLYLAMSAFGERLGKVAALFPVMYLSGGTCVILIITGGGTMKQLFKIICENDNGVKTCSTHSLSGVEWFLVFTCAAIIVSQLPNLNSVAVISLVGVVASITYCTLFWSLSVKKGRPEDVSYSNRLVSQESIVGKISDIVNAIGIIVLAFRGHNVVLEIQGTLPSNFRETSKEPMRRGIIISYILISMCFFPLAIAGFWAYGNKIPDRGLLTAFLQFHKQQVTKFLMGAIHVMVVLHCLSSYQVYAMPVFDNLELRYTILRNEKCPQWLRTCFRLVFGGITFFIAVMFPFLPSFVPLLGGITLVPVTYAYPCFMWLAIKKPCTKGAMWCFNLVLGCLGMLLSVLLMAAAIRTLVDNGLHANFFKP
ncbi:lysine/histidine transporter 8-like protein [Trifolium pratense]|uniref:Lysine/histidine transporter 8-like protein n=1 Tax=Trifolium pratense TaxID=57577 RepID=A0A2K3PFL7_TRIPR|nr:lysine/histidine transporter 8-like protein [Trifolium pratense]